MSYTPQGDIWSDAAALLSKAQPALAVGAKLVQDPYLPELSCEVLRLANLEAGKPAGRPCPRTTASSASIAKGIGLRHAVKPLRLYVYHRQKPWVIPLAAASVAAGVFLLGVAWGKSK